MNRRRMHVPEEARRVIAAAACLRPEARSALIPALVMVAAVDADTTPREIVASLLESDAWPSSSEWYAGEDDRIRAVVDNARNAFDAELMLRLKARGEG